MERQSRQRQRTTKHEIEKEIKNKKDKATIDKQTQTPKKMKGHKKEKKQKEQTEQSNNTSCCLSQDENNTDNLSQTNTSPQDKTESCPIKHTSYPQTHTTDNNQTPIS